MSKINLKLAAYLKSSGLTIEKLLTTIGTTTPAEIIREMVENGDNLAQIDVAAFAAIMQALRKLRGFPVGVQEVMQFIPDFTPEEMNPETNPFYERDMYGEIPPYDWGDVDPMEIGRPVRYIPGVGIVIEDVTPEVETTHDYAA